MSAYVLVVARRAERFLKRIAMNRLTRRKRQIGEESGFTMVELLIVSIISLIMLAGMVALVSQSFTVFSSSRDLQTINDNSRKVFSAVSRQLKGAVYLDNDFCDDERLLFYADIDSDNDVEISTEDEYENIATYIERVDIKLDSDENVILQETHDPDDNGGAGATYTVKLGSYVTGLNFYYFEAGVDPVGAPEPNDSYTGAFINENASMIRIVVDFQKGDVSRTFYRDVFLRILDRSHFEN